MTVNKLAKVAIIGAQGYSGRELARLLLNHPNVDLCAVFARNPDWQLSHDLPEPQAHQVKSYTLDKLPEIVKGLDTLFLATPADVSLDLIASYHDKVPHIIDLSGAMRLDPNTFATWYKLEHSIPELLSETQYGLSPWWQQQQKNTKPKIISNPGCYATCVLMSLLPPLNDHLIQETPIIIDAKSGLTGAGRSASKKLLFCEMSQDFYPYKIGSHQHQPEISTYINQFVNKTIDPILTTQVLPVKRGISANIYATLSDDIAQKPKAEIEKLIEDSYKKAYKKYTLVKFANLNKLNAAEQQTLLSLSHVVGSSRTHIAFSVKNKQLMITATIDNLLKGAASQAIENFNTLYNLPITTTLTSKEGVL